MKNTILSILCMATFILLLYSNYSKSRQINTLQKNISNNKIPYPKNQELDSLKTELFNAQTTITRYEITLDILKEEAPKAAAYFEKILSSKTE